MVESLKGKKDLPPFRLQREAPSQRGENNKREKSIRLKAEKRPRLHSAASRSGLKLKLRHGSFVWSCRVKEKTSQSGACEVAAKARRSIAARVAGSSNRDGELGLAFSILMEGY